MASKNDLLLNDLKDVQRELEVVIRASEGWAKNYAKDPKAFKKLIRAERVMAGNVKDYFAGLTNRIHNLVRWPEYQSQVSVQAYDVIVNFDDDAWQSEEETLLRIMYVPVLEAATAGLQSEMTASGITWAQVPLEARVQQTVAERIGDRVKGITNTTRNDIKSSIETSLRLRENLEEAVARLSSIIENEKRAELIARTEAVDAYQNGKRLYATEAGATDKTWEALPSATDAPCTDNNGVTVGINDTYPSGDEAPPAHPNCQCDEYFTYPNGDFAG